MVKRLSRQFGPGCRKRSNWTPAKDAVAQEMRRNGATYEQIAEVVGMSAQTVGLKLSGKRYSVPDRSGPILHHRESRLVVSDNAIQGAAARSEARMVRDEFEMFHGIVTSVFFGDPPLKYSALAEYNRKRAGA